MSLVRALRSLAMENQDQPANASVSAYVEAIAPFERAAVSADTPLSLDVSHPPSKLNYVNFRSPVTAADTSCNTTDEVAQQRSNLSQVLGYGDVLGQLPSFLYNDVLQAEPSFCLTIGMCFAK
jgi:hypothetical protein